MKPSDLRDYFAGLAMQQIMGTYEAKDAIDHSIIADDAYAMADAMLSERDSLVESQKSCPSGVEHLPHPSESIDALYMTARTARRLKEAGINTISDMLDLNEAEALKIPGFGRKSIYEIELQIADYGGLRAFRGGCKA